MRLASRRVKLFVLTVLSTSLVVLGLASQRARLEPVDLALLGPDRTLRPVQQKLPIPDKRQQRRQVFQPKGDAFLFGSMDMHEQLPGPDAALFGAMDMHEVAFLPVPAIAAAAASGASVVGGVVAAAGLGGTVAAVVANPPFSDDGPPARFPIPPPDPPLSP